jgi:hypothetical protein
MLHRLSPWGSGRGLGILQKKTMVTLTFKLKIILYLTAFHKKYHNK